MREHDISVIELAGHAGKIVLENGGEIYRVEQTMHSICAAYGIASCECFASPTVLIISASSNGEPVSKMMRISNRGINLDVVSAVNAFSRSLPMPLIEAQQTLYNIEAQPGYPIWVKSLAASIGVAAFTVVFGGRLGDVLGGLFLGAMLRWFVYVLQKKHIGYFLVNLLGGAAAALGGWLFYILNISSNQWIVSVAAMMLLVPGLLFTNALRDIAAGDLVSGGSRGMEVLSVAAALACGTAAINGLVSVIGGLL